MFGLSKTEDRGAAHAGEVPHDLMGYRVVETIGEGAGSLLYCVTHPETGRRYALKYVKPQTDKDQRFVEQLETEYAVGQLVRHPGLRRAVEMKVNRTLFRKVTEAALVLELFDGRPLDYSLPRGTAGAVDRVHPDRPRAPRAARRAVRAPRPEAAEHQAGRG